MSTPPLARRDVLATLCAVGLAGCGGLPTGGTTATETETDTPTVAPNGLGLTSSAFEDGGPIPTRFSCDGENVSPPLSVAGVDEDPRSLALVVDDPDAPGDAPFVHWLLWNLPPETTELPAGVPRGETVDSLGGARQGTNDHADVGYFGPCPPSSHDAHTYRFVLTALDTTLDVPAGSERPALTEAMANHAIQRVTLRGTFDR